MRRRRRRRRRRRMQKQMGFQDMYVPGML